jgi:hypothetical protein
MMKKLTSLVGYMKAPKATYLIKHPIKGPKNLLALRGAKAMLNTKRAAMTAAGVVAGAAAIPMAILARKKMKD